MKKHFNIQKLIVAFLFVGTISNAQEVIKHDELNTWFTMLNRININSKWSFSNELHERTGAFLSEQATFLERPSIDYHPSKYTELTFGYSYLNLHPDFPHNSSIPSIENNIWEQVLVKSDLGKFHISNRFRQEHRWFDNISKDVNGNFYKNGTKYGNRFRYRFTINTDIKKINDKQSIFVQAFDEIWLTQTDKLVFTTLSRNWFFAGVGYKFNANTNLQIGYMNQFDNIGPNTYASNPIIQTIFVKNFDL